MVLAQLGPHLSGVQLAVVTAIQFIEANPFRSPPCLSPKRAVAVWLAVSVACQGQLGPHLLQLQAI